MTDAAAHVLRPAPLSGEAVARWVRAAVAGGAQDAFCAACHTATQGNPFLVGELLREAAAQRMSGTAEEAREVRALGPEGVSTVVLQRVARLAGGAPEMARAVALLGEGARAGVAATLAELDPDAAEEAVEALCRADVLVRDGARLGFAHPIVLAAIHGDLPARTRQEGHARAARLLAERGAAPEEVGAQLLSVAPDGDPWVVERLRAAAARIAARKCSGASGCPLRPVARASSMSTVACLCFAERYDASAAAFQDVLDDARRRGSGPGFANAAALRAMLHWRMGSLSDAEADATAALALRDEVQGAQAYLPCALNALVFAAIDRGTAGAEHLELANDFFATQPSVDLPYAQAMEARGSLRALLGDPEAGLAEVLACGRRESRWVDNPTIVAWRATASAIALRMGDRDQARALAAAELERARRWGTPRLLGIALRHLALAEEDERRLALLEEAVAVLERSRAVLELARARIDLGMALVRAGRKEEGRELLTAGQQPAAERGAVPLVEKAHAELVASGARPRRSYVERDALTPSEQRVAEMAAGGMSNREIAQSLFVTEKTVETHLGRAYLKLGVRSRRQLPEVLGVTAPAAR